MIRRYGNKSAKHTMQRVSCAMCDDVQANGWAREHDGGYTGCDTQRKTCTVIVRELLVRACFGLRIHLAHQPSSGVQSAT